MTTSVMETSPIAAKEHVCAHCHHVILRGARHVKQTLTPWTMIGDDVDDDTGRTIYTRFGRWETHRYHGHCWQVVHYG